MSFSLRSPLPFLLWLALFAGCQTPGSGSDATAQIADDDREERIIANLKIAFPGLRDQDVSVDSLRETNIEGLHRGVLVLNERNQSQPFLVSENDTALYLLASHAIDVTLSAAEAAQSLTDEKSMRASRLMTELAGAPSRGPEDAPVTIVEFSDFQCPYCARGASTLDAVLEDYSDQVRLVFAHYPLPNHNWAVPAAVAAECAGQQSDEAFWTLHDAYFEHQQSLDTENIVARSRTFLSEANTDVDLQQWEQCVEEEDDTAHAAAVAAVQQSAQLGQEVGVSGTPHFFINGRRVSGAQPAGVFESAIEAELQAATQQ